MPIQDDFQISATGDIRRQAGASTTVYSVLELHAWLQDLADDASATGNDLVDILAPNPSRLDGPRDAAVASRLNLLTSGSIIFNLDDTAAQFINFGSIKQDNANVQYSGLKTIGGIVAASPVYVVQNGSKLTKFWADGHVQILVKVKTAGALIDSGNVTAFSRKWGQTYSHFDVNLSAGGESNAALSTAVDSNIQLTEANAALLSSKVTVTFGDTTQDLANGNGAKLYKGTITLSGGCTLQEAYQYLQYLTRESSTATLNSVPGWRYRVLNAAYTEIPSAPFGTFAGGTFFAAQGWYLTGVLSAEATRYQLIAHDGTTQVPPTLSGITVGNLVVGDRVLVAREDGSGGILKDEYTPVAASAGATALTVVETIKTDTPPSGVIRIKNLRYTYTSFTAVSKTFNGLSPALASNIVTADEVFVPFIDKVAAATSEAQTFIYSSNFTARVDVRNGSGATPIIPFNTLLSVTSAGASVNASRNSDV
jgi:LysM repeat protein